MLKNSLLLIIITYFALMSCGKGSAPAKSGSESEVLNQDQKVAAGLEIFKSTCQGSGCHENVKDNRLLFTIKSTKLRLKNPFITTNEYNQRLQPLD